MTESENWLPGCLSARWVTGKPPLYLLVLYYGLILWICIWFYRLKERRTEKEQRKTKSRERWVGVPGILLVCLSVLLPGSCWLMHQVQGRITVTVLDVGQEMESVSGCREERTV